LLFKHPYGPLSLFLLCGDGIYQLMARIFSHSGRPLRPAPWDPQSPSQFALGAGPTIAHTIEISTRPDDIAFVTAASEGNAGRVAAVLPAASSPDVHVKLPRAFIGSTRATTALHAASSRGFADVVGVLLEARADPNLCHGQLRALTPLHEASTVEVAQLLLQAGASPITLDPREPDQAWYHEQRKRPNIANLIKHYRGELQNEMRIQRDRLHPIATSSSNSSPAARSSSARPAQRGVLALPFSATELAAAKAAWGADGASITWTDESRMPIEEEQTDHGGSRTLAGEPRTTIKGQQQGCNSGSCECAICIEEMRPGEAVLILPCGTARKARRNPDADSGNDTTSESRPHAFHSDCLERWWTTKAGACPTCRAPLRPLLSRTQARRRQAGDMRAQRRVTT